MPLPTAMLRFSPDNFRLQCSNAISPACPSPRPIRYIPRHAQRYATLKQRPSLLSTRFVLRPLLHIPLTLLTLFQPHTRRYSFYKLASHFSFPPCSVHRFIQSFISF